MNQKGFSSIVIILIIVGILVVAGGVYWWQTKPSIPIVGGDTDEHGCKGSAGYSWCAEKNKCLRDWEESCTTPKDETADWKTYTNTKYNYQIKVPQDFSNQAKPSGWVNSSNSDSTFFDKDTQWYVTIEYYSDGPFYNPPSGTELISWVKEWKMIPYEYSTLEKSNFEIDGIPAVKIFQSGHPQAYDADIIFFIKDNKLFKIQMLAEGENIKKLCSQILSTFKFTK